jgi:type VI secretion system secreted protein VgrG
MPVTQDNRHVSVTTALGKDVLLFHHMTGSDQLGRLSEYRVQMLSTSAAVKIADVLGKPIGIHLDLPDEKLRHFHGIVTRFSSIGRQDEFALYEATVRPAFWLLTRSSNCRIFQDKSIVDIVKDVCADSVYGGLIDLSVTGLSGTYSAVPYCVQYRETDFNFVCRLLESAGIYFYFTHEESKHTMVLADSYGAHSKIPGYASVPFTGQRDSRVLDGEGVSWWSAAGEIQSSTYSMNDFDFEKATSSTSGGLLAQATVAAAFSQPAYEQFDYPGGYTVAGTGTSLARARMETLHGQCEQIDGETGARGLFPGGLFSLEDHPRDDFNREYLVTAAHYEIRADAYRTQAGEPGPQFQCRFSAVGKEHSYRPQPVTAKPVVQGPQTAMVVGKAGEEIWTDKYGRVKVQFHWDRLGKDDELSSCWVRVSQGWAGKGWGTMFIPRIGMEVVVSFLEGDPDRPLITGCVYNGDAMPPYALPAEQTKSTIKTNTSKGGAGYNEIRFEDKKDSEELYVQAEKDYNRVVKNNDTLKVGFEKKDKGDQTIAICNDQSLDVGNDRKLHVKNDQTTNIDNNLTVTIKNDESRTVNNNQTVKVDGDQKVTIAKTCVVEATSSIELKVGGSSIKIEPAKITIKSAQIAIEGSGPVSVKSSAILTIEGSLVKIN